jgi:hypothetical protein
MWLLCDLERLLCDLAWLLCDLDLQKSAVLVWQGVVDPVLLCLGVGAAGDDPAVKVETSVYSVKENPCDPHEHHPVREL